MARSMATFLTKGLEELQGQSFYGGRKLKDGGRRFYWGNCSGIDAGRSTLVLYSDGSYALTITVDRGGGNLSEPRILEGDVQADRRNAGLLDTLYLEGFLAELFTGTELYK